MITCIASRHHLTILTRDIPERINFYKILYIGSLKIVFFSTCILDVVPENIFCFVIELKQSQQ